MRFGFGLSYAPGGNLGVEGEGGREAEGEAGVESDEKVMGSVIAFRGARTLIDILGDGAIWLFVTGRGDDGRSPVLRNSCSAGSVPGPVA